MSIFEKIDRARHRRDINLCKPLSEPYATGFSWAEPDTVIDQREAVEGSSEESPAVPIKPLTSNDSSVRRFPCKAPV
jgi:hypothetical protein